MFELFVAFALSFLCGTCLRIAFTALDILSRLKYPHTHRYMDFAARPGPYEDDDLGLTE